MALAGNWAKAELNARRGALGGYQNKAGKPFIYRRGMPKLTPQQQADVLALYVAGDLSGTAIAKRYGIAPSYICKLAARRGVPLRQGKEARRNKSEAAFARVIDNSLQARMKRLRAKLEK